MSEPAIYIGHAQVLGLDTRTRAAKIRARTGAPLEHAGLYEQMSAQDNLEFYGRVYRLPLVFLDEPTAGLDVMAFDGRA